MNNRKEIVIFEKRKLCKRVSRKCHAVNASVVLRNGVQGKRSERIFKLT